METQTFGQRVKRTSKKVLRTFTIILVLVMVVSFGFLYWGIYEDGVMAGKILRVSEKGMMFKTYEGKITFIASEAEFTPKQIQTKEERVKLVYRIKIEVNNAAHELKNNMPVDGVIAL